MRTPTHWPWAPAWLTPQHILLVTGLGVAAGLLWSRSVLSISAGVALLAALAHPRWGEWTIRLWHPTNRWPLLYVLLACLSLVLSDNLTTARQHVLNYLPMGAYAIGFAAAGGLPQRWRLATERLLVAATTAMTTVMGITLVLNWEAYLTLLAKGKPVAAPLGVLPLSVGILHAFSVILTATWAHCAATAWQRWAWLGLCLWLLILAHLLANRTGLVCLYAVGLPLLVRAGARRWGWGRSLALVALAALGLGVAASQLPTLRAKVWHGWHDLEAFRRGDELTDWSLGRRLAAWHAAGRVAQRYPLFGAQVGDCFDEMVVEYRQLPYRIAPEHYINPHNQYLESLATFGLLGFALLALAWVHPWWLGRAYIPTEGWAFWGIALVAWLTDSVLEQQIGLCFCAFFALLYTTPPQPPHPEA